MNIKWTVLAFVAGAALSWGVYVPMVHDATTRLGSNLRAFLMVGVAYFLVAVLIPGILIFVMKNDPTVKDITKVNWDLLPMLWGIGAGVAGAAGALCVIFAVKEAGPVGPLIVAPLVFAGAPIINTFASLTIFRHGKSFESPSGTYYMGLVVAACGMAIVMLNKPKEAKKTDPPPSAAAVTESSRGQA